MSTTPLGSDGLPLREISPHTLSKFDRHRGYCGIFNGGMSGHWSDNRGYLELFAGSGMAWDKEASEEVDGCPLIAAAATFQRLAFVELDEELAGALEQRLRDRAVGADRARVFAGDANDPGVLTAALDFLPSPGLIFCFIDPEDINGSWDAIELLASRRGLPHRQRVDFLVNLPMGPMKRNWRQSDAAISRALGTTTWASRVEAGETLGDVFRDELRQRFEGIEYEVPEHKMIRAVGSNTPVYDLVFASGHERGLDFWAKIEKIEPDGQRTLF